MPYKRKYKNRRYRRSRRGKYSRKRGARSFQSRVKKALMKTAETKFYESGIENNQLWHNLGYGVPPIPPLNVSSLAFWFNPWLKIQQGTSRFTRVGDKITPRGMSLRLFIANKFDRPNTMVRLIVAVLPKEINGTVTTAVFDPFQIVNNGSQGNNMLLQADKDVGVKFIYDRIFRAPSNDTAGAYGKEATRYVRLWIKRKRSNDIIYSTTSQSIVNKPIAIYAIPYEQYSTLTTDNVATISGTMRMYYKDV